MIKLLTSN